MTPRCFADGIAQSTVYNHLAFHWGQGLLMLQLGYRDGNDMAAAKILGFYIRDMEERWREMALKAVVARARFDLQERRHTCQDA